MRNLQNYKGFVSLNEQLIKKATTKEIMDAYDSDTQVRSKIIGTIQGNPNYNSVFTAIKNYWTNQSNLLKNKPANQLTDTESNTLDTLETTLKSGDPREIENFAVKKIISGHKKELMFDKQTKTLTLKSYTETVYDKSIKSK